MNAVHSTTPCAVCACGGRLVAAAYSSRVSGLMFACDQSPHGCMSQEEGDWPDEVAGRSRARAVATRLGLAWMIRTNAFELLREEAEEGAP